MFQHHSMADREICMKPIRASLFLVICYIIQASGQGVAVSEYSDSQTYDKLQLSELLIKADRILTCVPELVNIRENDDQILFTLRNVSSVIEDDVSITNQVGHLFILSSKKVSRRSPVIIPGKKHLLFLKATVVDDAFRVKFALDKSAELYEVCSDWQAAVCLDFSIESLARNVLGKRYAVHDEEQFLGIVKNLTRWRARDGSKSQAIQDLLSRVNSIEGAEGSIYQEHIPQLLRHLGVKTILKNGKLVIEESENTTAPRGK